MILTSDEFPDYTCKVSVNSQTGVHSGVLRYKKAERAEFSGPDIGAIEAQFRMIAEYARNGAIVRDNLILTNYFNHTEMGEVLDMDGVVLGSWRMDFDENSEFTEDGATESLFGAPSLWLLHDRIADWYITKNAAS